MAKCVVRELFPLVYDPPELGTTRIFRSPPTILLWVPYAAWRWGCFEAAPRVKFSSGRGSFPTSLVLPTGRWDFPLSGCGKSYICLRFLQRYNGYDKLSVDLLCNGAV